MNIKILKNLCEPTKFVDNGSECPYLVFVEDQLITNFFFVFHEIEKSLRNM